MFIPYVAADDDVVVPEPQHEGDAGYDIVSRVDIHIWPGEMALIPSGVSVQLPEDCVMMVVSRSGLTLKKGLVVPNSPGIIDSGYRGDVGVILHNISKEVQEIKKGERIAQALFMKFESPTLVRVDALDESSRGTGGFGSTGTV